MLSTIISTDSVMISLSVLRQNGGLVHIPQF